MKTTKFVRHFLLASGLISLALCPSARAQLLANFQASSFNATTDTLTDSVNGIVATAANGGTNVGGTGYVTTTGAGFTFNADSVPGLEGLTSYVLAVGFTYNGGAPDAYGYAYLGAGVFGGDLPGGGDGDANLSLSNEAGGQIQAGLGAQNGNDYTVYDTSIANGGNFITGAPTGAVLVVNGATETLYVNGVATTQGSPLTAGATFSPFGNLFSAPGGVDTETPTTTYAFGIGTNTNGTHAGNPLNGDITQAQIYSGTMTAAQAEALSLEIGEDSVPEPSTWAMLAGGLVALLAIGRFRRRSAAAA